MTIPYPVRLLCLSLACFYLVHLAVGLAVALAAPRAMRWAERSIARVAARRLAALRLLPAALALFVVGGFCVPSYLWLEPRATVEEVSLPCLAAAVLGLAIWAIPLARAVRGAARSLRHVRECQRLGSLTRLAGESWPAWVIEGAAPCLALAGFVRPRLVISRGVLRALSTEQLQAALRHERAHWTSRDNLKRLLILAAPDVFPFCRAFAGLERGWARVTEWAADDRAVAGDSRRSISLAAALVRVARLGGAWQPPPVTATLLGSAGDLAARVERLLRAAPADEPPGRGMPVLAAGAVMALAAAAMLPATLYSVHGLLERLVH